MFDLIVPSMSIALGIGAGLLTIVAIWWIVLFVIGLFIELFTD